ncbi:MAG TPA: hypothetical protein VGX68_24075 [Thermoanaerobaculia bacterium]|nr:hypothetical protein [Thermoanaerobaculia bacterium]
MVVAAVWVQAGLLALPGLAANAADVKKKGVYDIEPIETEIITPMSDESGDFDWVSTLPVFEKPPEVVNPRGREKPLGKPEIPDQFVALEVQAKAAAVRSFAGLDFAASVGSDGLFRPPDTILGKSSTYVLEGTNSAIRLMTLTGVNVATKSLNSFFNADPITDQVLFDPRIIYDRLGPNQRFLVVALQRSEAAQTSSILLAVSKSPNPSNLETTNWCRYRINSLRPDTPVTWADYPMVGVGADAFLISDDQWTFPDPGPRQYKYGVLRVFNKSSLTNNTTSCPALSMSTFVLPGTEGSTQVLGHVQPAIHYTAPTSFPGRMNPTYMVSTVVPSANATYRVWRVANATTGPTLDVINLTVGTGYATPPRPKQPGGVDLELKDNRIMQVAARGDTLWAAYSTKCATSFATTKACIRAVRFFVYESGGTMTAILQEDLTFASPDTDADKELSYFMPGITYNANSSVGIVFLASGPNQFVSSAWTTKGFLEPFFYGATVFNAGSCAKGSSRVGDYVGAQTNPDDSVSFWFAGESALYTPATGQCTWNTKIVEVVP